jgi:hypothetical protein
MMFLLWGLSLFFCCMENVSAGDIVHSDYVSMLIVGVPSDNSLDGGDVNSSHDTTGGYPAALVVADNDGDAIGGMVRVAITYGRSINLLYFKFLLRFIDRFP